MLSNQLIPYEKVPIGINLLQVDIRTQSSGDKAYYFYVSVSFQCRFVVELRTITVSLQLQTQGSLQLVVLLFN